MSKAAALVQPPINGLSALVAAAPVVLAVRPAAAAQQARPRVPQQEAPVDPVLALAPTAAAQAPRLVPAAAVRPAQHSARVPIAAGVAAALAVPQVLRAEAVLAVLPAGAAVEAAVAAAVKPICGL